MVYIICSSNKIQRFKDNPEWHIISQWKNKRRSRLILRNGIPKYFWEYMDAHEILDPKSFSFPSGKEPLMLKKLRNYIPDADYEVTYSDPCPFDVKVQENQEDNEDIVKLVRDFYYKGYAKLGRYYYYVSGQDNNYGMYRNVNAERVKVNKGPLTLGLVRELEELVLGYTTESIYKSCVEAGWIRDLTRETIEPNPGPTRYRPKNMRRKRRLPQRNNPPQYPITRPMSLQGVQPPFRVVPINYELSSAIYSSSGPVIIDVIQLNNAYDLLQSSFTQTIQFFNYMGALYGRLRVLSIKFFFTFDNQEQVPIDLFWFETPNNPVTSFATRQAVEAMAGTGNCVWRDTMSEQYGKKSQVTMIRKTGLGAILGNKAEYNADVDYTCTPLSGPTRQIYGVWVALIPLSSISTGFTFRLSAKLRIKFYDRNNITSPLNKMSDEQYWQRIKHLARAPNPCRKEIKAD